MSRPEKPIDWQHVDDALAAGCFGTELAEFFHMHPDTFYNRVKDKFGMGFTEYSSLKKEVGNALLKLTQFKKAIGASDRGDNTLLIWLGKIRLDQREKEEDRTPPLDQNMDYVKLYINSQMQNTVLQERLNALESKANGVLHGCDSQI